MMVITRTWAVSASVGPGADGDWARCTQPATQQLLTVVGDRNLEQCDGEKSEAWWADDSNRETGRCDVGKNYYV